MGPSFDSSSLVRKASRQNLKEFAKSTDLLRPERSEGLHFFNAALDRGYAQFQWATLKWSYFMSDWDETWVDLS